MASNFDFKDVDVKVKEFIDNTKSYFESLNKMEQIAWILIGAGFVLFIVGLIL